MAEDEIIQKHTKAAYKTWRDPDKKWMHKLKDILVEVLIIVFAVSISIWLHGWAETRKDHKEEKEFYTGVLRGFESRLKGNAKRPRISCNRYLTRHIYLLSGSGSTLANIDSLMIYSSVFFTQVQISPRISRFETLKGSGKLGIIEDKINNMILSTLTEKNCPFIFRTNETFNSLTLDKIAPTLGDIAKVDSSGQLVNIKQVLNSAKLQLQLIQLKGGTFNCINAYTAGIEKANEIINEIEEELK